MKTEIWNVGVSSIVLLLIYAAWIAAADLTNASLADSKTKFDSKLGYYCTSVFCIVSIVGSFLAPVFRCLGYRVVITLSTLLHLPFYAAMIFLHSEAEILLGAAITGTGDGVTWVVLFDYLVSTSRRGNIERNMSYFIFVYNFATLGGNLMNYFNLENANRIDAKTRIHSYAACCAVTVLSAILGLVALRPIPAEVLQEKAEEEEKERAGVVGELEGEDEGEEGRSSDRERLLGSDDAAVAGGPPPETTMKRMIRFLKHPATVSQFFTSIISGMGDSWVVIILNCIRNTYDDRKLIPIFGVIFGSCRIILTGTWDVFSKVVGYRTLIYITSAISLCWLTLILLFFPPDSIHDMTPAPTPINGTALDPILAVTPALLPVGSWGVILLGVMTGLSRTWMDLLKQISCGKCSRAPEVMAGFEPSVMFAFKTIIWSSSSAATYALVPFLQFHVLVVATFVLLIINHFLFDCILIKFFTAPSSVLVDS